MTVAEKTAYLNGLLEGLSIKKDTDEGKMIYAIVDALNLIANDVTSLNEVTDQLSEEVDDVYEELECIEDDLDVLFGDGEDDCCCGHECTCDDDKHLEDEISDMYELVCPECGKNIVLDEDVLSKEKINCPECGEELELDFSDIDDKDGNDEQNKAH